MLSLIRAIMETHIDTICTICTIRNDLYEDWLSHLTATGRKKITTDTYRKNLRMCLSVLAEDNRPQDPANIRPEDFVYLKDALPQKEEVRRAYMRTLALWCEFVTGTDPMKKANLLFNREQRNRRFITDAEFRTLYEHADPALRMAIILGGMLGLRRAEIAHIRDEDIHGGYLTVYGKGHGQGLRADMRLPKLVEDELVVYRQWKATKRQSGDGYLIQNGAPLSATTPASLSNKFRKLALSLNIDATMHSLRRFYATSLYQEGADVVLISRMMRHADVSTTVRAYISDQKDKEREAMLTHNDRVTALLS